MQDRYAGDVGGFGKFVMLRSLSALLGADTRLGINWYRVTNPERNNDGRHVAYLDIKSRSWELYRACDSELYEALGRIIRTNERSVLALEEAGILPAKCPTYSAPLRVPERIAAREAAREAWFRASLNSLKECGTLILDPDNGLQTPRVMVRHKRAIKYVMLSEVSEYLRTAGLVIVYNHRDRSPVDRYAVGFQDVARRLGGVDVRVLRFRRVSVRDYVFFCNENHSSVVDSLFRTLLSPPKDFLFVELQLGPS